jgi:lysophospholipase L1-like esterase
LSRINLSVFGDSCAVGFRDSQGGWAERLKVALYAKHPDALHTVHNFSISGSGTDTLLNRLEPEARALSWGNPPIFLFAIGKNDCSTIKEDGNSGKRVEPEQFRKNLQNISEIISKTPVKITYFLSLCPVNEALTNPTSWNSAVYHSNQAVQEYNKIIQEHCKENGYTFIDVNKEFMDEGYKKLLHDGLHPNDKGHEIIMKTVLKAITPHLA